MRTVTFAEPRVVDLVHERFVAVWNNHNPDRTRRGVQAPFAAAEVAAYPEGGGGNNLHTLVAQPDGRVVLKLTGYWTADTLLEELAFARGLTNVGAGEAHARRERALLDEADRLEKAHPEERGRRVRDSAILRRVAALRLLAKDRRPPSLCLPVDQVLAEFTARGRVFV